MKRKVLDTEKLESVLAKKGLLTQEIKQVIEELSTSTSTSDYEHEAHDRITDYLITDAYGNTKLSEIIEGGDIDLATKLIKEACPQFEHMNAAETLKQFAIDINQTEFRNLNHISDKAAPVIYSEIKHQLNLLGVDTSEVVEAYNFDEIE